jgi:ABC-2 type transport system permease protein
MILTFLRKEFAQLKRDRNTLRLIFISPLMQLIIFGYAANFDVNNVTMVVCDMDNSATSRELISHFPQSGYFTIVKNVGAYNDVDRYLDRGDASIAVVIPRDFGKDIAGGKPAELQLLADGSESSAASTGLNYAGEIVGAYSQNILLKSFSRFGGTIKAVHVDPEVRVWYNPALKSRNYLIPGLLAQILVSITLMITALAIVKEKEIGTLDQLLVTPLKPYQLIIGKLTPFTIIGFIDMLLVLAGVTLWFGIPVRGSLPLLLGLSVIFLTTSLGLGLFVSTISRTQQQAMMTAMFFVMMPMNFLSGFIFPIENMPKVIQAVTYLMPLRYFYEILRDIFLRGVGIEVVWPQALAMLVFGVGIFTLAVQRFKASIAS